jgi:predicted GNAT family N-acyltransferase
VRQAQAISYKNVETEEDRRAAFDVRRRVFVVEQGVADEIEYDEYDATAIHYLATLGRDPVAAARAVIYGEWGKIGRVAVVREHRGEGIGIGITRFVEDDLAGRGITKFFLHAQTWVQGFYEKLGYLAEGDVFQEADIDHVRMTKRL